MSDFSCATNTYIDQILLHGVEKNASDIYIRPDMPVFYRLGDTGEMESDNKFIPSSGQIEDCINVLVKTPGAVAKLHEPREIDLSYSVQIKDGYRVVDQHRFRVNIALSEGRPFIVARRLKYVSMYPEELGVPDKLVNSIASVPYGLFLVVGPTGCGKSTTLASILMYLMQQEPLAVVTIEDPIEYQIPPGLSFLSQREVGDGRDTKNFATGLRAAVREKPDVIMVGEIRDPETAVAAIQAAKSGHRVLSTLHSVNAPLSVSRIAGMFPADRQAWIKAEILDVLTGVMVQALVPGRDGKGRVLCTEYLDTTTLRVREALQTRSPAIIRQRMAMGEIGWTLNQDLMKKVESGLITIENARRYTNDVEEFGMLERTARSRANTAHARELLDGKEEDDYLDVRDLFG